MIVNRLQSRYHEVAHAINRINKAQKVTDKDVYLKGEALFPNHWNNIIDNSEIEEQIRQSPEPSFKLAIKAILLVTIFCATTVLIVGIQNISNTRTNSIRISADSEKCKPVAGVAK